MMSLTFAIWVCLIAMSCDEEQRLLECFYVLETSSVRSIISSVFSVIERREAREMTLMTLLQRMSSLTADFAA